MFVTRGKRRRPMPDEYGGSKRRIHIEGASKRSSPPRFSSPTELPTPVAPAANKDHSATFTQSQSEEARRQNETRTLKRIELLDARYKDLNAALTAIKKTLIESADKLVDDARKRTRYEGEIGRRRLESECIDARQRMLAHRETLIETLAPEVWSADLSDSASVERVTSGHTAAGPNYSGLVRIGAIKESGETVPALAPLIDSRGWLLSGRSKDCAAIITGTLSRIVHSTPLKHLQVLVFDPKIRGTLGGFAPLRSINGSSFPQPSSDAGAYTERVQASLARSVTNAETISTSGATSLRSLWADRGIPEGVATVLIILDYPFGVNEELNSLLIRAALSAGANGTTVLVQTENAASTGGVDTAALHEHLHHLELLDERIRSSHYPENMVIVPDAAPDPKSISSIVELAAREAASIVGPTIPLGSVLTDDLERPWSHSSEHALDFPIGLSGKSTLSLSMRTSNPPLPNTLVGGAVGQGKSNLLLDIIYSIATRYSPKEVEFFLLDFKRGLEFKRFDSDEHGNGWLPHAKVLGLESDLAFGNAVLRYVHNEMDRRSRLFKSKNAGSIDDYRMATGHTIARLVLVIDEFHVMLEGDDDESDEALDLLETLAKQGRAYGIHLILASQTLSGVKKLAIKGDAIFGQFPLRLSLKNTASESQTILSQGNTAAADLVYRGEVILNRNFGGNPATDNERGVVAYAETTWVRGLQQRLWAIGHDSPPLVFLGNDWAILKDTDISECLGADPDTHQRGEIVLLIGRPVAVDRAPAHCVLAKDTDQAVAVIGSSNELARAALRSILLSAVLQLGSGSCITVIDGSDTETGEDWFTAVSNAADRRDVRLVVVPRHEILGHIHTTMSDSLRAPGGSGTHIYVGIGLQRVAGMDEMMAPAYADEGDFANLVSARDILRQLASRGAIDSSYLVGWWTSVRAAEQDLGPYCSSARLILTAGLGREDLRSVIDVSAKPVSGHPRLGSMDRSKDEFVTVVPFDPQQQWEIGVS